MTPESFVERFGREKASAILRCNDTEKAALAMEAAIRGGFSIIEFTLTIPGVYDLVRDFSQRPGLVVGTGTVMDAEQARKSVEAGARFLVSPVIDEVVISEAGRLGVACMPGTHTPTEMLSRVSCRGAIVQTLPGARRRAGMGQVGAWPDALSEDRADQWR